MTAPARTHAARPSVRIVAPVDHPKAPLAGVARPEHLRLQALQRSAGNRAVANMVASTRPVAPVAAPPTAQRGFWGDVADAAGGLVEGAVDAAGGLLHRALNWVTEHASRIPGYRLLCLALGRDLVSGAEVARTGDNLVGAIAQLVPGGTEMLGHLQQAGVIQKAADWVTTELPKLGLDWTTVRGLFSRLWDSLGARDLLDVGGVWDRVVAVFTPPIERIKRFAISAGPKLMEIVFEGVVAMTGGDGPGIMAIIRRAGGVLSSIVRDPIAFAGRLVDAVRGGLGQFAANIGTHLRSGLFGWLTGALSGIPMPTRFDLGGIVAFVGEMLGLTWTHVRTLLVRRVGEPVVAHLESALDWVQQLATRGIAAIADKIAESAEGLVDTVIGGVKEWVANSVVGAAITRLISMFNPAGAIIQAIIAVYNTIKFFMERASQLAALANSVFDSVGAIASGAIGNAMNAVEQAMARSVPVVLGFLSRLIGLGDIAAPVRAVITRVRTVIDTALDRALTVMLRLAGPVIRGARRLLDRGRRAVRSGVDRIRRGARQVATAASSRLDSVRTWLRQRRQFRATDGTEHSLSWRSAGSEATLIVSTSPMPVRSLFGRLDQIVASGNSAIASALASARQKFAEVVIRQRAAEESGPQVRSATAVDALNRTLEELSMALAPLLPVAFPARYAPGAGGFPPFVEVGRLVKVVPENRLIIITAIDHTDPRFSLAQYVYKSPNDPTTGRAGGRVSPGAAQGLGWAEASETEARLAYLGRTPGKNSPTGQRVTRRMADEGKIVNGLVRYTRNAAGDHLPEGQFTTHSIEECDMGHLVDAVTWWNSNGRFADAATVKAFMEDAANYELEPSGPNQARGRALAARGIRYLPRVF